MFYNHVFMFEAVALKNDVVPNKRLKFADVPGIKEIHNPGQRPKIPSLPIMLSSYYLPGGCCEYGPVNSLAVVGYIVVV